MIAHAHASSSNSSKALTFEAPNGRTYTLGTTPAYNIGKCGHCRAAADLQAVKERLGHRKISTTERYLHTAGA